MKTGEEDVQSNRDSSGSNGPKAGMGVHKQAQGVDRGRRSDGREVPIMWGSGTQPAVIFALQRISDNVQRHTWLSQLGRCYQHLVGKGQGCC